MSQVHMNGLFLEKPGILKEALKREDEWARTVPGYDSTMSWHNRPISSLERGLIKLSAVRELGSWANEFIDMDAEEEDDGSDGKFTLSEDEVWEKGMADLESGGQFDPDGPVFHQQLAGKNKNNPLVSSTTELGADAQVVPNFVTQACVTSMPNATIFGNNAGVPVRRDSVIVMIRHGKTQHNKLGLFTGWVS